jgi:prepilin-type N-terminal cleavage/methylation domain-containing protein
MKLAAGAARRLGFTLIEVALAIFIMALLLTGVVLPLRTQLEVRMVDETQRLLEEAKEALLGYAAMYGHFPCPASATSNGFEAAGTLHEADDTLGERVCPGGPAGYIGFLPAAELGITTVDAQGYAIDGWGQPENRIRYAVSDVTIGGVGGVVDGLTSEGGIQGAGIDDLNSTQYLHVCRSSGVVGFVAGVTCGPSTNVLTTQAAVVIWSVGANARTGGAGDEAENPNPNGGTVDKTFVSRPRSPGAATAFDDMLVWIPLPLIVNRLVAVGYLP